jgi:hypothetical protein
MPTWVLVIIALTRPGDTAPIAITNVSGYKDHDECFWAGTKLLEDVIDAKKDDIVIKWGCIPGPEK